MPDQIVRLFSEQAVRAGDLVLSRGIPIGVALAGAQAGDVVEVQISGQAPVRVNRPFVVATASPPTTPVPVLVGQPRRRVIVGDDD